MQQIPRLLLYFIAFASSVLPLSGCQRDQDTVVIETNDGKRLRLPLEETIRIKIPGEPPSLDWQAVTDSYSGMIAMNIMAGLVDLEFAPDGVKAVPSLAKSWRVSPDGRHWTFELRADVKWSDGVAFKAEHVLASWKRLLSRESASPNSHWLFNIKKAREFFEGHAAWSDVGVKSESEDRITVTLEEPVSYFPFLLTHHSTFPIREDLLVKYGKSWTEPGRLVTLGPFSLSGWWHDKLILLERNDTYFGPKVRFRNLAVYMIQDATTALNLYEAGKLDSVHMLPATETQSLKGRRDLHLVPQIATTFLGVNVEKAPFKSREARQALASAIDRHEIVKVLAGIPVVAKSFIPPGLTGHDDNRGWSFDPGQAIEKFQKSSPVAEKVELRFSANENNQRIAENLQAQLQKNLKLKVELRSMEFKTYMSSLETDPPALSIQGWSADFPDPHNFMAVFLSSAKTNRSRWKNKLYDDLVARAAVASPSERNALYAKAEALLIQDEVPAIPLFTTAGSLLVSKRLENYPLNAFGVYPMRGVSIRK